MTTGVIPQVELTRKARQPEHIKDTSVSVLSVRIINMCPCASYAWLFYVGSRVEFRSYAYKQALD